MHESQTNGAIKCYMNAGEYWQYLEAREKREEKIQARLDAEQAEQGRVQKERQVKEVESAYKEWHGQGSVGGLLNALNKTVLDPAYKGKVKPDIFIEDIPRAIQTLSEGAGEVGHLLASFDVQNACCDTKALGYFLQEVSGITEVLREIIHYSHYDTNRTLEKLLEEKESV